MANPIIGYVECSYCGGRARVSECKKAHQLCIACEDGCAQQFTRTEAASLKVRAKMKPKAAAPSTATTTTEKPKDEKPNNAAAGKPAASGGSEQPARKSGGFGILGRR